MTVCVHLCRGNFKSAWVAEGGYEPVAEVLFNELDVDGYFLEYDDARSGDFAPLRFVPKGKTVVLGLVTTKLAELESKDSLKRRIDEAAKLRAARAAVPVAAVRLLEHGARQRDRRRGAGGQAAARRRDRARSLGRRVARVERERNPGRRVPLAHDSTRVSLALNPGFYEGSCQAPLNFRFSLPCDVIPLAVQRLREVGLLKWPRCESPAPTSIRAGTWPGTTYFIRA